MKVLFSIAIIISIVIFPASAQKNSSNKEKVYLEVDEMPEYPGGKEGFLKFIASNVKYPEEAKKKKISGKVFVSFVVDKKGVVTDARVVRTINDALDKEALRVINLMAKWKPGKMDGKPVDVQFTVPILFKLGDKEKS